MAVIRKFNTKGSGRAKEGRRSKDIVHTDHALAVQLVGEVQPKQCDAPTTAFRGIRGTRIEENETSLGELGSIELIEVDERLIATFSPQGHAARR